MSLHQQQDIEKDFCKRISYNKLAVLIKVRNTCIVYFKTRESLLNSLPIDDSSHIMLVKDFCNFEGNLCAEIRECKDYEALYEAYITESDYIMLENYLAEYKISIIVEPNRVMVYDNYDIDSFVYLTDIFKMEFFKNYDDLVKRKDEIESQWRVYAVNIQNPLSNKSNLFVPVLVEGYKNLFYDEETLYNIIDETSDKTIYDSYGKASLVANGMNILDGELFLKV